MQEVCDDKVVIIKSSFRGNDNVTNKDVCVEKNIQYNFLLLLSIAGGLVSMLMHFEGIS